MLIFIIRRTARFPESARSFWKTWAIWIHLKSSFLFHSSHYPTGWRVPLSSTLRICYKIFCIYTYEKRAGLTTIHYLLLSKKAKIFAVNRVYRLVYEVWPVRERIIIIVIIFTRHGWYNNEWFTRLLLVMRFFIMTASQSLDPQGKYYNYWIIFRWLMNKFAL